MNSLVLLVPAGILAIPVVIMARHVIEVRRWHRAPGVVLSTGLRRMRSKGQAQSFRPLVRYRYTVDGKEFCSEVITHGRTVGGYKPRAQRIIDAYPPGASITVLHHPSQPDKACLEAEFGFFPWVLVVVASVLFLLAVSLAV